MDGFEVVGDRSDLVPGTFSSPLQIKAQSGTNALHIFGSQHPDST